MIQRYTHPEMGRIWSDQRRYETWLLVEIAAAEAMADATAWTFALPWLLDTAGRFPGRLAPCGP